MNKLKFILALIFLIFGYASIKAQPFPPSKENHLKHLKKVLQLNEEQTEKVKDILKVTDAKITELQNKSEIAHDKEMDEIEKIFSAQDTEISKVLNDTQKKKYSKLKEDEELRGPGQSGPPPMGGRDGMPPPPPDEGMEPPF